MFNKYPYTDNNQLNLDWFLEKFKELYDSWVQFKADTEQEIDDFETAMQNNFEDLVGQFDDFKDYVNNYLDTLDFPGAVADVITEMVNNGTFLNIILPSINSEVTEWLNDHVTPVGSAVVVDNSLTIAGAAADAKVTGDNIAILNEDLVYNSETLSTEDGFSTYPITKNAMLINDGSIATNVNFITTDFVPVKYGIYKITRKNFTEAFTTVRCLYDSQKNLIDYATYTQDTAERIFTIPSANVAYIRFSVSKDAYESGISFRLIEDLKDEVNVLTRNVHGNLCGDNPNTFYPISLEIGDYLTLSTSDGSVPTYVELEFYDENYNKLGVYSLSAAKRTVQITATVENAKYIKWSTTPSVPCMVEFGVTASEYKEYDCNIFDLDPLKKNVEQLDIDVYGNLCGNDPTKFYSISVKLGDYLTISTSDGSVADYVELQFYDENYNYLGAYSFNASKRTVQITATIENAKYIKWSTTPSVPCMVEFGVTASEYKEYNGNIFQIASLLNEQSEESQNVYTYGILPIVAVMSYNVGEWYDGTRNEMPSTEYSLYENLQKTILRKNYASIFCAQEYYHTMYTNSPDAKKMFLYPLYKHVSTLEDTVLTRGKALATNLWVDSVESVDFVNQSGVAQRYQKSYVYINGHKVCICNIHLSQLDNSARLLEAGELVSAVENEDYYIVLGDFNAEFDRAEGIAISNLFTAIGAKACNCGEFGTFYTYRYSSVSSIQRNQAIDNIFVSPNINIKKVYMDMTKIDAELPIQDHVPLIAYLEI